MIKKIIAGFTNISFGKTFSFIGDLVGLIMIILFIGLCLGFFAYVIVVVGDGVLNCVAPCYDLKVGDVWEEKIPESDPFKEAEGNPKTILEIKDGWVKYADKNFQYIVPTAKCQWFKYNSKKIKDGGING